MIALAGAIAVTLAPASAKTPFTHEARIPADANVASIRFESAKEVRIAPAAKAAVANTMEEADYCEAASRRDQNGSMFCAAFEPTAYVTAYAVTYSYEGQPMASDEYAGRRYTFTIYLRPEELTAGEQARLSRGGKLGRSAGEDFEFTVSRPVATRRIVDNANSNVCPGNYVDGNWIPSNSGCSDRLAVKTVTAPAGYLTIDVEPAARRMAGLTR